MENTTCHLSETKEHQSTKQCALIAVDFAKDYLLSQCVT